MDLGSSKPKDPLELRRSLTNLVSEAQLIEVHKRGIDHAAASTNLFPHLMDLVGQTVGVLKALESWSKTAAEEINKAARNASLATNSGGFDADQLESFGNLCSLVAAELRSCRDQSESISCESGALNIFASIEEVESRLLRGLCAVEPDLARLLGLSSKTRNVDLCRSLLRIRRLIGRFRRRVAEAKAQDTEKQLRSLGSSLAWLRGQDDFSLIRGSDRLIADNLQERIIGWLKSSSRSTPEARHILEEIAAFGALADLVNRRQELMEHDRRVVSQLIGELSGSPPHGPVPGWLAPSFHSLLGRDDLLDEMLASGADTADVLNRLLGLQISAGGLDRVHRTADSRAESSFHHVPSGASARQRASGRGPRCLEGGRPHSRRGGER